MNLSCHFMPLARMVRCAALLKACGSWAAGFENAVITKTAPGLDLSFLDQDLAERRCHKAVTTKTPPSNFYGAFGTAVLDRGALDLHLQHSRSPDPCRPWLYGEECSSANPEASAQGWQRLFEGSGLGGRHFGGGRP